MTSGNGRKSPKVSIIYFTSNPYPIMTYNFKFMKSEIFWKILVVKVAFCQEIFKSLFSYSTANMPP